MRKHAKEVVFNHVMCDPSIVKDIAQSGKVDFNNSELWPGGPTFALLPGIARPDEPGAHEREGHRAVWDFWFTDYDP
eukprot:774325-Lingulodinium_polyedra.AAC.1